MLQSPSMTARSLHSSQLTHREGSSEPSGHQARPAAHPEGQAALPATCCPCRKDALSWAPSSLRALHRLQTGRTVPPSSSVEADGERMGKKSFCRDGTSGISKRNPLCFLKQIP